MNFMELCGCLTLPNKRFVGRKNWLVFRMMLDFETLNNMSVKI